MACLFFKVNKKLLLEEIRKETGKDVTLKDISNIVAKTKNPSQTFDEVSKRYI